MGGGRVGLEKGERGLGAGGREGVVEGGGVEGHRGWKTCCCAMQ